MLDTLLAQETGLKYLFYFILLLGLINIGAFIFMAVDKYKAVHNKWRVKEIHLLIIALFFGATGVLIGMVVFKHKINNKKFNYGIPFLLILNKILKYFVIYYILK
ncbi:DUF1294 domain-containing protein [Serpentinicella sp. ANB-PHB4]|uniref:DUF1294 domain-containing protein n=1 Tax=Serpentinicella sp. ANB-PHB4 TaxID=3074076 RepID=UPI00285F31F3|nr:DUF1294 domain-containing protein [Serpentinicella sp. ANB-PHB4]MDR5658966.1 DUF1294 domain-containing protein [Serpentinicella sp. ANB-PHB4]